MEKCSYDTAVESVHAIIQSLLTQMQQEPERIFYFAFSGGSSYSLMFDIWATEYLLQTPWSRMRIYWVDEWCEAVEHSESNYGTMHRLLLKYIPGIDGFVYPIDGLNFPEKEATRYSDLVCRTVPVTSYGAHVFDAVFLEAEPGGDLSCIYSGQEELLLSVRPYTVCTHPLNGRVKISMTGRLLLESRQLYFLLVGKKSQKVVRDIFRSGDIGPAAYVAHHGRHVSIYTDRLAEGR